MHRRLFCSVLFWSYAAVVLGGCGGGNDKWKKDRPKVASAEGSVKYKGAPIEGAIVIFVPQDGKSAAASAMTDAAGNFKMSAFSSELGAVPGKYKVTVSKTIQAQAPAGTAAGHDDPNFGVVIPPQHLIPEKYSQAETSGLIADVPEAGKTDFLFDLKD